MLVIKAVLENTLKSS